MKRGETTFTQIDKEKLLVLSGDIERAKQQAAVRRIDLSEFARLEKNSSIAAGSPTKNEFDALVYDVHNLIDRLNEIGAKLSE